MIRIAVFKDGTCVPGCGHFMLFETAHEADKWLRTLVLEIPVSDIGRVSGYRAGEYASIDEFINFHNLRDKGYSAAAIVNTGVEEIDLYALKEEVDTAWQARKEEEAAKRRQIDQKIKNMSNEDMRKAAEIIQGE